jgi:hypothetical protein
VTARTDPAGAVELQINAGVFVQLRAARWPAADATAALGRLPPADQLAVRVRGPGPFDLGPLFAVRGLKQVRVEHESHAEQELEWAGLSALTGLRRLEVRSGTLPDGFWHELGRLPRLREVVLWWPEGARARPGSLARLASLRRLGGVCLFDPVPAAFRALARCPGLKAVHIDQCAIDDAAAAGLGAMAGLTDVYVRNTQLSDTGMRALCRWPRVESLVLCEDVSNRSPITAAGFTALGRLTTLERLHLQGFEHVGAAGWAALRRLPRLKRLKLMSRPPFDLLEATGRCRR